MAKDERLFFEDSSDDEAAVIDRPGSSHSPVSKKDARQSPTSYGSALKRRRLDKGPEHLDIESGTPGCQTNGGNSVRPPVFDRRFIGTFIVPAWSLSKGSSYIQQGDRVLVTRQKPKSFTSHAAADGKKSTGKVQPKQAKLMFVSKPQAPVAKKPKEKVDVIVRFTNVRGE